MRGPNLGSIIAGISIRWRIALPFILLALALGLSAVLVVNQLMSQDSQERYWRQVVDSGQQASDAVVRIEQDLLKVERLIANTEGLAAAAVEGNAEALRDRALPLVINADLDTAIILDNKGNSIFSVRHNPNDAAGTYERAVRGESFYTEWEMVQDVLGGVVDSTGDKYGGIESIFIGSEELPGLYITGPIKAPNGDVVGAVLVGEYLETISEIIGDEAGANISLYGRTNGAVLESTLELENPQAAMLPAEQLSLVLQDSSGVGITRIVDVTGSTYGEVLLPLAIRDGSQAVGVMGVSLLAASVEAEIAESAAKIGRLGVLALVLVVVVGLLISNSVVRAFNGLSEQTEQIVSGVMAPPLSENGAKEISRLAHNFNQLLGGQDGNLRTLTARFPQAARLHSMQTVITDPENGVVSAVTMLVVLVKRLPDRLILPEPDVTLANLNAMFSGITPIIEEHGGIVHQIRGDECIAHFGVTPQLQRPQVNSLQATHAAMEIREFIEQWNRERAARGLPAVEVGLGVATGDVIVG